ncbi:MAG TPA: hypothetical protein VHY35_01110 [Stellaceae bacterium]|nr:hypothetical protein [Stellaceae bacterium]
MLATARPAIAQQRPAAALLLDRLCADELRPNEEDRLFGTISITVRATIKYQAGVFSPDLIDDSVQDAVSAMMQACPKIRAINDAQRLGMAVELIRDATLKRMRDPKAHYSEKETEQATAADLSQELSAPEIDAWLDGLPPRQRSLALFLYASDVSRQEVAEAVGVPQAALVPEFSSVKGDLLKFFRSETNVAPPPPSPSGPPMEYRVAGATLTGLLAPKPAAGAPVPAGAGAATSGLDPAGTPTVRITGISSDVYAGWSLLATVRGLPADRSLDLDSPILVEPNAAGHRRMIVVGADEISDPHDSTRRFLLRAFSIDGDKEGAGLHDTFHLAAADIDNPLAQETLHNKSLASIEVARCLWHDYGTGDDPGLCH